MSDYARHEKATRAAVEAARAKRGNNTTVVLWHGTYRNDGAERLLHLQRFEQSLFGLRNPRLVGQAGDWQLIADANRYQEPTS